MKTQIKYIFIIFCLSFFACSDNDDKDNLDYTTIDKLIADCRQLLDTSEEGSGLGEFVSGSKAIFEKKIQESEHVRNNTDRQSALDSFFEKLTVAKEVFLSSKVMPACPFFNGTAYIDCGPAAPFYNETFTLEAWAYITDRAGGSIIGAEGFGDEGIFGYLIRLAENGDDAIDFCVVNGTWSSCYSPNGTADSNKWIHVAASFDSQTAKVYINGLESGSMTIAKYIPAGNTKFIIGDFATWNNRFFRGKIYDVRVWNTVRTQQEIADNYKIFLNGDEAGLVANWQLNTRSGNEIIDITGNYPATLHNITWSDLDNIN